MINFKTLPEHYSNYFFEELLQESPETFVVAEREGDGKVVGYIMCRVEYGFSNLKKFGLSRKGHVVSVAVFEEDRGKGLGRVLVEEALKGMKSKGCSEAYLEVKFCPKGVLVQKYPWQCHLLTNICQLSDSMPIDLE